MALQAWKHALTSDANQFTAMQLRWCVLRLRPIWPFILTVAGCLPEELGLLKDLALFHMYKLQPLLLHHPDSFIHLKFLYELDISNNHFSGPFPGVVFFLHSLKCLDVRFNEFEGSIPPQLFDLKLDALSINSNRFPQLLRSLCKVTKILVHNSIFYWIWGQNYFYHKK